MDGNQLAEKLGRMSEDLKAVTGEVERLRKGRLMDSKMHRQLQYLKRKVTLTCLDCGENADPIYESMHTVISWIYGELSTENATNEIREALS